MSFFLLEYILSADYPARREQFRARHLELAEDAARNGEMIMGGPVARAEPLRGLMLFQTHDSAVVERFAQQDPYVVNGLVSEWSVREWVITVLSPTGSVAAV